MSIITTTHHAVVENAPNIDDFTYEWAVTEPATIISGQGTPTVVVSSDDSQYNTTFFLTCKVTSTTADPKPGDAIGQDVIEIRFDHIRSNITFGKIDIVKTGVCSFVPPATACESIGTYSASANNANIKYNWYISSGTAVIAGDSNRKTVDVKTTDSSDFTLSCDMIADLNTFVANLTTRHTNNLINEPIRINDMTSAGGTGYCVILEGQTECAAQSSYRVVTNKPADTFKWSVSPGASIVSDDSSEVVTVESIGSASVTTFSLTCVVTYGAETATLTRSFSHRRAEESDLSLVLTGNFNPSATYVYPATTATITESYEAIATGIINPTYNWTLANDNANIIAGQNEKIVTLEATNSQSVLEQLTCDVTGDFNLISASQNINFNITDATGEPVIESITDSGGFCRFTDTQNCIATSSHTVQLSSIGNGIASYVWTVIGASIVSGQGTDTIEVTTNNSQLTTNFTVKCDVTDNNQRTDSLQINASHSRELNQGNLIYEPLPNGGIRLRDVRSRPWDRFGIGLSLNKSELGDFLIVGARGWDTELDKLGAVFVYQKDPVDKIWKGDTIITPNFQGPQLNFGIALASYRDKMIIANANENGTNRTEYMTWDGSNWVYKSQFNGAGVFFDTTTIMSMNDNMAFVPQDGFSGSWDLVGDNFQEGEVLLNTKYLKITENNLTAADENLMVVYEWVSPNWVAKQTIPDSGSGYTNTNKRVAGITSTTLVFPSLVDNTLYIKVYTFNGTSYEFDSMFESPADPTIFRFMTFEIHPSGNYIAIFTLVPSKRIYVYKKVDGEWVASAVYSPPADASSDYQLTHTSNEDEIIVGDQEEIDPKAGAIYIYKWEQ